MRVDLSPRLGGHTCVPPTVERDRRAWPFWAQSPSFRSHATTQYSTSPSHFSKEDSCIGWATERPFTGRAGRYGEALSSSKVESSHSGAKTFLAPKIASDAGVFRYYCARRSDGLHFFRQSFSLFAPQIYRVGQKKLRQIFLAITLVNMDRF